MFGMFLSKPGKDVNFAQSEDMIIDPVRPNPLIQMGQDPRHVDKVRFAVPATLSDGRTSLVKIQHNYPYVPAVLPFIVNDSGSMYYAPLVQQGFFFDGELKTWMHALECRADKNFVYLEIIQVEGANMPGGAGFFDSEFNFKYYIFAQAGL